MKLRSVRLRCCRNIIQCSLGVTHISQVDMLVNQRLNIVQMPKQPINIIYYHFVNKSSTFLAFFESLLRKITQFIVP